jgi:flagellar capping protein FliD
MMEAMREAWTDERLDDLANRMDRGFDRVDAQFARVDAQFERVDRRFEAMESQLHGIQKAMVQAAFGISAAFIAGFAALAGLIAAS